MNTEQTAMSQYYERHIFFCLNQRINGESSCGDHGAQDGFDHCKKLVKKAGLSCAGGPVAVVYPEGTWYTFVDQTDIEEIVESHLVKGQVVERLVLPPDVGR
jgi:(2Fe-2S) ferredoxin